MNFADYYDLTRFRPQHIAMLEKINELGPKFAERAPQHDKEASFPTKNYNELRDAGFLKLVIPEEFGGLGFTLGEYATIGAEIGKYCGATAAHEDTMDFAVHKDAPGLSIVGEWDPIGMRGTVSRDLILKDVFVSEDDLMMPAGVFGKTLSQWPHMMATLSPAYMGVAQSAYDFTVEYLRGETPGQPPIDRRVYPTKRATVGKMFQKLTEMRSLWTNAFLEAKPFPSKAEVMRIYAAQYAVMEGVQEMAALAIRTCGGQSMLKTLPLERIYRDRTSTK